MILSDILLFIASFILAFGFKSLFHKYLWIIPVSIFAGLFALTGSSQILKLYHFSDHLNLYIDLLLAVVFCTFPLSITDLNPKYLKSVKKLWQYSALQYFSQWGLSLLITILILKSTWPFLTDQFGLMLPSGFAGGHGSAAVVGDLLQKQGFKDAISLAMTMATIGALGSVIGGIFWILWGRNKGLVNIDSFGVHDTFNFPKFQINRKLIKTVTIIILIVLVASGLKPVIISLFKFEIPIFVISVAVSVILRLLPIKLELDQVSLGHITNTATDILVCVGIASIKLLVVQKYLMPIVIMSLVGFIVCILYFLSLGLKVFKEDSFSKAIFTWGWSVGGLVFGLALVKIVNPKKNYTILQQFALTYLMLAPIEISLLLTMPYLVTHGYGLYISIGLLLLAFITINFLRKNTDK